MEKRYFDGSVELLDYDIGGRCTRLTRPDGTIIDIAYDICGNVVKVSSGDELLFANKHNVFGRVTESRSAAGVVGFEYDACGRIVGETQNGERVDYVYGANGNVVRRRFSGSRCGPLNFSYDKRGRLAGIADEWGSLESFVYDARDFLIERHIGSAVEHLAIDRCGRLTHQAVRRRGGAVTIERFYHYDPLDNVVRLVDSRFGEIQYHYDPGERLSLTRSGSPVRSRYAYDDCGNLTAKDEQALRYLPGDRLAEMGATTFVRDANGNIVTATIGSAVTRYVWDPLGQLVRVLGPDGSETAFGYDGTGRRLWKEHAGRRTLFFWAGNDLLSERDGDRVTDYAMDSFWLHMQWENGAPRHAILTPSGQVRELLGANGELLWWGEYDDWGRLRREESRGAQNRLRLAGQYWDAETGLHYNRFRYYHPEAGQFISPDPIGLLGGTNRFRYAPNALNWEDPFGLACTAKTSGYSVYILTNGSNPEKIVYVGITEQHPHERLSGHRNDTSKTGKFDNMRVIATNLTNRRDARNIEGSVLYHVAEGNISSIPSTSLINAPRNSGGYWHGYHPGDSQRPIMSVSDTNTALGNNIMDLPR